MIFQNILFYIFVIISYFGGTCFAHSMQRRQVEFCPTINIKNGKYKVLGPIKIDQPGAPIPNNALVKLTCNANYELFPESTLIICENGNWNVPVPECKPTTCPPGTTSSGDMMCTPDDNSEEQRNDFCPAINMTNGKYEVLGQKLTPGARIPNYSVVKLTCDSNYELYPANPLVNCIDGKWNIPLPQCKPKCPPGISSSRNMSCIVVDNPEEQSDDSCPAIILENGKYEVLGQKLTPGARIPNYGIVKLTCDSNYGLYPANPLVNCIDGKWNVPLPKCKQTCAPRTSSSTLVTCTVDGHTVNCSQPLVEGTLARSTCKHFYTQSNPEIPISRCSGGSWDNPLIRCVPECGEANPDGVRSILDGHRTKISEFPWHVGLYRLMDGEYKYMCGGSIITPLVILTVAHCFIVSDGAKRISPQEYYVAAGKYYSDYNSTEDKLAQKNQVTEYYVPPQYRGYETNFMGDLAVAILVKPFEMTRAVRPICIDWDNKFESEQLRSNNMGKVAGWGYVDSNKPLISAELKQLNTSYIDLAQCLDVVPGNFRRFVTADKFCAGYTNGTSLCKGDTGGGIVFKSDHKFYIRGLVSVGPVKDGVCANYSVYTRVSAYLHFILNFLVSNPISA